MVICLKSPSKITAYFIFSVGLVVVIPLFLFFIQQACLQGNGAGAIWGLFAILNDLHLMAVQYFKIRDDAEYFSKERNFRLVVYSGITIFVMAVVSAVFFTVRFAKGELEVDLEYLGFISVGVFLGLCGIFQSVTFCWYEKNVPWKVTLYYPNDEFVEAVI